MQTTPHEPACAIGIDTGGTFTDAVDMQTTGIGGDRLGELTIGPRRVQPLAMSDGIFDPAAWIGAGSRNRWIGCTDCMQIEAIPHAQPSTGK